MICKFYITICNVLYFWSMLTFEVFYSGIFWKINFNYWYFFECFFKSVNFTTYFKHGQWFIWVFLVLTFIESGYSVLLATFAKYILSQIYSHGIQNCIFWHFLEIVESFIFWRKKFQNLLIFMFFIEKTVTSITQEWSIMESYLTPKWIVNDILIFHWLV